MIVTIFCQNGLKTCSSRFIEYNADNYTVNCRTHVYRNTVVVFEVNMVHPAERAEAEAQDEAIGGAISHQKRPVLVTGKRRISFLTANGPPVPAALHSKTIEQYRTSDKGPQT